MSRPNYDERWFFPILDRPGVITRWSIGTIALTIFGTLVTNTDDWLSNFLVLTKTWIPLSFLLLLTFGYGGKWLRKLNIAWSWVAWAVLTCTFSLCVAAINETNFVFVTWSYLIERLSRDILFVFLLLYFFDGEHRRGSSSWAKARLDMLQARMRPHFLFNTLNNLAEMIQIDPDRAENAVLDLADLSRAMLQKEPEIAAIEERANAEAYLRLEKLRMDEKLKVIWDWTINDNTRLPSLLLQPLLENAIKYGIEPIEAEYNPEIFVKGWEEKDYINVTISNPISDNRSKKPGNGVTLPNLAERLEWLYPNKHRFRTKEIEGIFEVSIRIPKKNI